MFSIDVNGVTHPLKLGLEDDPIVLAEVGVRVRSCLKLQCD